MKMTLYDKIQRWHDELTDEAKYNLMLKYFPEKAYLVGLENTWMSNAGDKQMEIYNKEKVL